MTMISKRVEDGEPFDVGELFDGLAKQLIELIRGRRLSGIDITPVLRRNSLETSVHV